MTNAKKTSKPKQTMTINPTVIDDRGERNVATVPEAPLPVVQTQADKFIEMAITSNAPLEQLEKLLDMKERYDKLEEDKRIALKKERAEDAFAFDMSQFKKEDINIVKDQEVGYQGSKGWVGYKHASLGHIIKVAMPLLAEHGFSHHWVTKQENGVITVTCFLTHKDGFSRSEFRTGSADDSGKKNAIQQVSSTTTYFQRYTFLAVTGLAVEEDEDDDGVGSEPVVPVELLSEEQAVQLLTIASENNLLDILIEWLKTHFTRPVNSIDAIPAEYFEKVMNKLKATIQARETK